MEPSNNLLLFPLFLFSYQNIRHLFPCDIISVQIPWDFTQIDLQVDRLREHVKKSGLTEKIELVICSPLLRYTCVYPFFLCVCLSCIIL
jgi:hypothetical protein